MTNFPNKNLNQKATYWERTGNDGYGWYTFAAPVTIDCRWTDKQEVILDGNGKEILSDSVVSLNQVVVLSGFLYLGEVSTPDPKDVDGAQEIKQYKNTSNLKATAFRKRAWLKRR